MSLKTLMVKYTLKDFIACIRSFVVLKYNTSLKLVEYIKRNKTNISERVNECISGERI